MNKETEIFKYKRTKGMLNLNIKKQNKYVFKVQMAYLLKLQYRLWLIGCRSTTFQRQKHLSCPPYACLFKCLSQEELILYFKTQLKHFCNIFEHLSLRDSLALKFEIFMLPFGSNIHI